MPYDYAWHVGLLTPAMRSHRQPHLLLLSDPGFMRALSLHRALWATCPWGNRPVTAQNSKVWDKHSHKDFCHPLIKKQAKQSPTATNSLNMGSLESHL